MARRSAPCTQADLTRMIKAALAAGIGMERITGMKVTRDGAMLLFGPQKPSQDDSPNEWDEVLGK